MKYIGAPGAGGKQRSLDSACEARILFAMDAYDPLRAPGAAEWLSMDEGERLALVTAHHRGAEVDLPNVELHATFHMIVENQLAESHAPVQSALDRLIGDGLDRHEAIHAIGSVLSGFIFDLMSSCTGPGGDPNERYFAELEKLTAAKWRKLGE